MSHFSLLRTALVLLPAVLLVACDPGPRSTQSDVDQTVVTALAKSAAPTRVSVPVPDPVRALEQAVKTWVEATLPRLSLNIPALAGVDLPIDSSVLSSAIADAMKSDLAWDVRWVTHRPN